ncbi:MAG: Fe-S-containing hydro-lyase [Peptococcaceae bacterium]
MGTVKRVTTPLTEEAIAALQAGDSVLLSGVIYTARDKAHKLLTETLAAGKELPVDLRDQLIYYVGPAPAKPGQPIGSCGPTTSSRMDSYAPMLIRQAGLKGMLGKGPRSQEVIVAMKEHKAVYLAAIGGTGVAISHAVKKAEVIAYEELGTCAIRRLEVEDLPCIVAIDCEGNNLYEQGIAQYRRD